MGIEPTQLAWKARTLPLSYTRNQNMIVYKNKKSKYFFLLKLTFIINKVEDCD